ncbi:MAG: hypothetical protein JOZ78_00450 [Chroococcidiopsidaceae cyanobacterium CP_BM_ER_R8_30]|nr:hypothetical protein [Chroococcidiopsidaceae cyanobacterium CP_BM_ER_R8_30]
MRSHSTPVVTCKCQTVSNHSDKGEPISCTQNTAQHCAGANGQKLMVLSPRCSAAAQLWR